MKKNVLNMRLREPKLALVFFQKSLVDSWMTRYHLTIEKVPKGSKERTEVLFRTGKGVSVKNDYRN